MNINALLKNAGNTNLQQVSRNNLQKTSQQQAPQTKQEQQDEYIHEEITQTKANAVIYDESGKPQNSHVESVEPQEDSESVSFNPYTFDAENKPEKEDSESNMTVRANDSQKSAQPAGAPITESESTSNDDESSDEESELEKLELERAKIRQNLNTEQDDSKKESLRVELRSIEIQITQLKAELSK